MNSEKIEARVSREVGSRLRRLREARGFSQHDLCERVTSFGFELTESSLSRMERGKAVLGTPTMSAIAICLGISLDEIDQIIQHANFSEDTDFTGKNYESLFKEGRRIARSGYLAKSLQIFNAAHDWLLIQDPPAVDDHRLPDVLIWQGYLLARLRNFRLATDRCLRVLNRKSSDVERKANAMATLVLIGQLSDDSFSARLYARELETLHGQLSPRVQARTIAVTGNLHAEEGDFSSAVACYERSLALYRCLGDCAEVARALALLGYSLFRAGTRTCGAELIAKAVAEAQKEGCEEVTGFGLRCLGITELLSDNYSRASSLIEDAALIARKLGDLGDEFEYRFHLWRHHKRILKDPEFESRRLRRKLDALVKNLEPRIPEVRQYLVDLRCE